MYVYMYEQQRKKYVGTLLYYSPICCKAMHANQIYFENLYRKTVTKYYHTIRIIEWRGRAD